MGSQSHCDRDRACSGTAGHSNRVSPLPVRCRSYDCMKFGQEPRCRRE
jgi:hypothetical protein